MGGIGLYIKLVGASLRSQMQYRASFAIMTLGNLLTSLTDFVVIWALFARFAAVRGWTLYEVSVIYGMGHMAFALCELFMREFDMFNRHVRTGEFDRMLLRPRSTVLQMLGAQIQLIRLGRFMQGAAVFCFGVLNLAYTWTSFEWALVVFSVLSGALLFAGVIVLQATSCFWIVESLEVWNSITYGGITAAQYPLTLYQKPIRYLFTFVIPLAIMGYWPCSILLRKAYAPPVLAALSPLLGAGFFGLSLLVWKAGVRHYTSTGS